MAQNSQVKPAFSASSANLARNPGGLAASVPVVKAWMPPGEFSSALEKFGFGLCPERIRKRCNLPDGHPLKIVTHPGFPGRHYIPRAELFRLVGIPEASA